MPGAAFTVTAAFGAKCVVEAEFQQGIFVGIRRDVDIAAIAPVAAARATSGDEFLPSEGDAAVSAVAGFDCDFGFVDEHRYGHADTKAPRHNERPPLNMF
jgi:hypothetical protein